MELVLKLPNTEWVDMLAVTKQLGAFFYFPIHERRPTVFHLAVHLENGTIVYLTTQNVLQRTIQPPSTTMTSFFYMYLSDDIALTLLY